MASATPGSAERAAGARSEAGALPSLIVIGAQKCGTSGLHFYLGLHPQVSMSSPKEVNFFIAERNWPLGVEWYRSKFDPRAAVRGEASPNYTAYPQHEGVPERIAEVVPGARLIYIVRDPIERIAAHWVHNYSKGRHDGELISAITSDNASYIARSRYAMQLERYLAVFPREQILVLEQDDLRDRRDATLAEVFTFAGADESFTHRRFASEQHKTERKTRPTRLGAALDRRRERARRHLLSPRAWAAARGYWPLGQRIERPRDLLEVMPTDVLDLLRSDAERLRELTGRSFANWSLWQ